MKLSRNNVIKNKKWHVPVSIATLATGIYLTLVLMLPSFAPEYHEVVTSGKLFIVLPYIIFVMISSPLFTLWHYTKRETDGEFRELHYEQE